MYQPMDGRHVIALIDDYRPSGPVEIEQHPVEDYASGFKPNRRGDRRQAFNLRCAGVGCKLELPRVTQSTITAALDQIAGDPAQLLSEIMRRGWGLVVDFHDEDIPATEADEELMQERFEAEMYGAEYVGSQPVMVPRMVQRYVIPWPLLHAQITSNPHRRR
jgi:hypothetical protein